jgi:hypothetical protein
MNEKIKSMYADGFNVNQIAAIYMIPKAEVDAILDSPVAVEKPVEKPKTKKVEDKPLLEWIDKYKANLNLELNKIDGKIIDPNTHTEGAARHKAGRDKSVIEFNDNTQGDTWYHELAHVINNKIRQIQPNFLEEFKPDIDRLTKPENLYRPLNEKFADAFTRIYTDPNAPRTRLANVLEKQFVPKDQKKYYATYIK